MRLPDGSVPPLTTVTTLGVVLGGAVLIGVGEGDSDLADSVQWTVWKLCAGVALGLFLALFVMAVRILREPGEWGIVAARRQLPAYLLVVGGAVLAAFLWKALNWNYDPELDPINDVQSRTNALLLAAMLAATPLVTIVWLVQQECIQLKASLKQRDHRDNLGQLLALWKLMVTVLGGFAAGVAAALVTAGALRATQLEAHPQREDDFPASNVLFYGGFFAVFLTLLALPMVLAWRARARQLVDTAHDLPPDGLPTDEWQASRARLEHTLHLDSRLLANPLTALTVFTPLVTSLLAAFIPQLGS